MRNVFAVFEGGGGKGVMHVATLAALEHLEATGECSVRGYAGTSAGALIAALAAVGYRSDEILDRTDDGRFTSKLLTRGKQPVTFGDLFPLRDRMVLRCVGLFVSGGRRIRSLMLWLSFGIAYFAAWILARFFTWVIGFLGGSFNVSAVFCFGLLLAMLLVYFTNVRGAVRTAGLYRMINDALSTKMAITDVTFGHLRSKGIVLHIVVTDVEDSREAVFSSCDPAVDDVIVALAVLASCAIPFVFRPVDIGGRTYVDGGLSSNLPAWVFDGQTVHDTVALVVASVVHPAPPSSADRPRATTKDRRPRFLNDLFRSLVFGSNYLHLRSVRQLTSVQLPAEKIQLLDLSFRVLARKLGDGSFSLARVVAQLQLNSHFIECRRQQRVHDAVSSLLAGMTEARQLRVRTSLVRGSFSAHPMTSVFTVWNCIGFDGDADRHSVVAGEGSLIGHALEHQSSVTVDFSSAGDVDRFRSLDMDGLLWDRLPKDIEWMMIVPLPDAKDFSDRAVPELSLMQYSLAIVIEANCPLASCPQGVTSLVENTVSKIWTGNERTS